MKSESYTFHVHGMHCTSCTVLIENELTKVPGLSKAVVHLKSKTLSVEGNFNGDEPQHIAEKLSALIKPFGYTLAFEQEVKGRVKWREFKIALPVAIVFIVVFILLQKTGLVSINPTNMGLAAVFTIGLVASVSSCMAVVGGFLLSLSATLSKNGSNVRSQVLFHVGRVVGFFLLGGLLGLVGSVLQINFSVQAVIGILVGLLMLLLGVNLMEIFPWMKKIQPTMPKKLSNNILKVAHAATYVAPLLIGAATFFLPCGFTQSMQVFALSTGSFLKAALIMFVFALGTLPVLTLISFGAFKMGTERRYAGIFFKTVGIVVVLFALLNIINSFAVLGITPPLNIF